MYVVVVRYLSTFCFYDGLNVQYCVVNNDYVDQGLSTLFVK